MNSNFQILGLSYSKNYQSTPFPWSGTMQVNLFSTKTRSPLDMPFVKNYFLNSKKPLLNFYLSLFIIYLFIYLLFIILYLFIYYLFIFHLFIYLILNRMSFAAEQFSFHYIFHIGTFDPPPLRARPLTPPGSSAPPVCSFAFHYLHIQTLQRVFYLFNYQHGNRTPDTAFNLDSASSI